jgi:hypothetical protein
MCLIDASLNSVRTEKYITTRKCTSVLFDADVDFKTGVLSKNTVLNKESGSDEKQRLAFLRRRKNFYPIAIYFH